MKKLVKYLVIILVSVLVGVGATLAVTNAIEEQSEPEVSASLIEGELSECSDLATAELTYRGVVDYEEGDITLINKKSFMMTYEATVRAGVDLSQCEIEIEDQAITVTLPEATIQTTEIDADSIEFYDESFAIFNWEDKEDAVEAMEIAEEDVESEVDEEELLEEATTQAHTLVENLLSPFTAEGYDYTVTVVDAEGGTSTADEEADAEDAEADATGEESGSEEADTGSAA